MGKALNLKDFIRISLTLTRAQMKSRYRKTITGFLWVVLNPILLFGVHALIFKAILKVNIPNYFLFLLGGLLPWIFITNNISMATSTFVIQRDIIRSFSLSPLALLFSQTLDNFINFLAAFALLLISLIIYSPALNTSLLLLPIAIMLLLFFTLALTTILATFQVFFRDVQFITQFINNILYLLTPIFYSPEYIPENYRWLVNFNPYYIVIRPFQLVLNNYGEIQIAPSFFTATILCVVISLLALFVWKKAKRKIYYFI